jgi:hypothetical protein
MHTYIFELDIMGFTPGSACGRAAVYSAWVWRSFGAIGSAAVVDDRRVGMVVGAGGRAAQAAANLLLSPQSDTRVVGGNTGAATGCAGPGTLGSAPV